MMKRSLYTLVFLVLLSCTSNTIYKKPDDLIPKDSMVMILKDLYIANSARNHKTCKEQKYEDAYAHFIYEKYKIDTIRFSSSNRYYTSDLWAYKEMLGQVKKELDTLIKQKQKEYKLSDNSEFEDSEEKELEKLDNN